MLGKSVNEIVLTDYEDVTTITKVLVDNEYAVMTTREEAFWIVNYTHAGDVGCHEANRNNVVFQSIYDDDYIANPYVDEEEDD